MVSLTTRSKVWHELYEAERMFRYCSYYASSCRWWHQTIRAILLASVLGAVIASLRALPGWVQVAASLVVGASIVCDYVWKLERKARLLDRVQRQCAHIKDELEALWLELDGSQANEDNVRACCKALTQKATEATTPMGEDGLNGKHRLNQKCAEEARQYLLDRYPAASSQTT